MEKNTKKVLLGLLIIFTLIFLFGRFPDDIGFPSGLVWHLNPPSITPINNPSADLPLYAKDLIKISNLTSRREIYSFGENITIDVLLENPYNYNYNLSVYWVYNDTRFFGWSTENNSNIIWSSWVQPNTRGQWKANVVITWQYLNTTFDTDKNIMVGVY